MKVAITDYAYEHVDAEREIISAIPAELVTGQCRTEDEVIELARDADGLICQFAPITCRVIKELSKCRVIVRYAIGVDIIDVKCAEKEGIHVCNVPDYGVDEVSDHAMLLLLAAARKLPDLQRSVVESRWSYLDAKPVHRIKGATLGLAGFGRIPRLVAKKALAFGMKVIVFDPYVPPEMVREAHCEPVGFDDLLAAADYISVHTPLTEETRHLFGSDAFGKMKRNPILVNTSRGGVIDESALLEALKSGQVTAAALDVTEKEPINRDNPLLTMPNVMITPHSAWYSEEAIELLQRGVAEEVARVLTGNPPKNPVNHVGAKERGR